MRNINIKYQIDINVTNKVLFKRNKVKNPFTLINSKIKLLKADEEVVKKVIAVEIIPIYKYTKELDIVITNTYYTSSKDIVDIYSLKENYNCYDNNLIILTVN